MTTVQWILLIAMIIYFSLIAVAFKFPRTRENWHKERKQSIQILMSSIVFIMLFLCLWYVSYVVDWPDAIVIVVWSCALTFVGLVLVGIFAPHGIRMSFEKKKETKAQDEDE